MGNRFGEGGGAKRSAETLPISVSVFVSVSLSLTHTHTHTHTHVAALNTGFREILGGWRTGGVGPLHCQVGVPPTCPTLSQWQNQPQRPSFSLPRIQLGFSCRWVEKILPALVAGLNFCCDFPRASLPAPPRVALTVIWAAGCLSNQATKRMKKWPLGCQPGLPRSPWDGIPRAGPRWQA